MDASQLITDRYALYMDDCCEVMPKLPDGSVHFSVYSPPFAGLYHYSSSPRDLSNSRDYDEFMEHYRFVVDEIYRLTMPGRSTAVHCMDIPNGNTGGKDDHLYDFPGDIIRLHADIGFKYVARYHVWKEPLAVRNRTMAKKLAHWTIVHDSSLCAAAGADYLLVFRRNGDNPEPITHEHGLIEYAGARDIPPELLKHKGFEGNQIKNRYSQWIWRQYASAFWDDIRLSNVLPYKPGRDKDDERHVHPLQLDVIDRALALWSNPGDTVLTPFMGVGSEVYAAVRAGRRAIGIELKQTYFNQAVKNLAAVDAEKATEPKLAGF